MKNEYWKNFIFYVAIVARLGHIGTTEAKRFRFVSGCSSGVEHNLAKVGVVGSNPIARSNKSWENQELDKRRKALFVYVKSRQTNSEPNELK